MDLLSRALAVKAFREAIREQKQINDRETSLHRLGRAPRQPRGNQARRRVRETRTFEADVSVYKRRQASRSDKISSLRRLRGLEALDADAQSPRRYQGVGSLPKPPNSFSYARGVYGRAAEADREGVDRASRTYHSAASPFADGADPRVRAMRARTRNRRRGPKRAGMIASAPRSY